MNANEFARWLDYQEQAEPGIGPWFKQLKDEGIHTMKLWQEVMEEAEVPFETACRITRMFVSGQRTMPAYSRLPGTVCTISEEIHEYDPPKCDMCKDGGWLFVKDENDWTIKACTCTKGDKFFRKYMVDQYDATKDRLR